VQHTGISRVEPASEIDPDYARTLREAIAAGVEVIAYGTKISVKGIELDTPMMFSESA
jgi:sugar fermentation stimulation protein A